MKKVLIATEKPFAQEAVDNIKSIAKDKGYEIVLLENYTEKSQLLKAVADVDAMIIRSDKADKEVLDASKNLKVIVRAGAGFDNIDLETATKNNVVAMNTPGQNSNAVAELVFGMLVYITRNGFNGTAGTELKGKKIGLHGFGYIGKNAARIAKGFGMEVFAFSPTLSRNPKLGDEYGVTAVKSVEEIYKNCQYVTLQIPTNDKTRKSINKDLLSLMPKNAVLINTARKEVIHEEDLLSIMDERPDFKYLSDIAPDCAKTIASKYPERFFFTPKKMGAQTAEANINAGIAAINQIINFIENGDDTFKVN